ncbi:MAG: ATP-binding protein, partial [Pseudomonadota bacterium]
PMEIKASISAALDMMEPQLRRRNVRITKTVPTEAVYVMGDRIRLEQVMINLLRNALDATRGAEKPAIEILLAVGEDVLFTVRDNGPGIEDLDQLFEPFYTTKSPGDGVGLGLAISSSIVNDLGGRLTARNAESGGAVFMLTLPPFDGRMAAQSTEAAE